MRARAVYASGLDFHLSDAAYVAFFAPQGAGLSRLQDQVGHRDVDWDLKRLGLLRDAVGTSGPVMVDANEAWSPKEAIHRLDIYRRAGFEILWIEDPCLRDDYEGLREIRLAVLGAGELGRVSRPARQAPPARGRGADLLNVHGHISDVMKAGWLAPSTGGARDPRATRCCELGCQSCRGGAALPEADWLEYSFQ
jgi:L-alanine-DL-glutamate epimerase-like enolase superfamily enzyme